MKQLTITRSMYMLICIFVLALLGVGGTGIYVSSQGLASLTTIRESSLAATEILGNVRQDFMDIRVFAYAHAINTEPEKKAGLEASLKASEETLLAHFDEYETLADNPEQQRLLSADRESIRAYMDHLHEKVLPASNRSENELARSLLMDGRELGMAAAKAIAAHIEYNDKRAEATTASAVALAASGRNVSIGVMVSSVLALAVFGILLAARIRNSLAQLQSMVAQVESNLDFTVRVPVIRQDELGQTMAGFNRLLDKLQQNLRTIQESAHSVAEAASTMSSTATQVATTSHQQSEAASDMAATVEEMTVSINHVSDRAQETNRIANDSGRLAVTGEQVIGQTANDIRAIAATVNGAAELIQGLEQHSQQITNVVAVIKEVAEQTNLLALNAAIEAARAGEQGRGFAVVADEVRKLAERTAASTKEISETIATMHTSAGSAVASMQEVVAQVSQGVERAQEANSSIRQIGEGSRNAMTMVGEIAEAIQEQGAATNNIALQVERIAQMSEESSAAAANSAEAAKDLDRLAQGVQSIIRAYRL